MKKTLKHAIVMILVAGLCLSFVGIGTAVDPTFGEIDVSPENPERLSDVTFTVDVEGENITDVRINVEECIEGMCYSDYQNISMQKTGNNTWEATVTLIHDDAIYGTCWLVIESNGEWFDFKDVKKEFDISAGTENGDTNGGNGGNGGNGDNGTPGFELIVLVISVIVALFIYKRKIMK